MNLQEKLYNIIQNLEEHHRNKSELTLMYIEERLNLSLDTYDKEVQDSIIALHKRKDIQVMRNLNKEKKYERVK